MIYNNTFRGENLTGIYNSFDILNIINGNINEDIYIGDYICINDINFRIAQFQSNNTYVLFPDESLYYSKMNFKRTSKGKFEKSYINQYKIPELYITWNNYMPIKNIVMPCLFNYSNIVLNYINPLFKKTISERRYWLSDVYSDTRFYSINSNGSEGSSRADAIRGIRPFIIVGYTVICNTRDN